MRVAAICVAGFLLAAAFCYAPAASNELGSLIPVETLIVTREAEGIQIDGGTVCGPGADWEAAMEDLLASAAGTVFLETVERMVFAENAGEALAAARKEPRLRPSVQLYILRGEVNSGLAEFAAAQEGDATLERDAAIPVIVGHAGRYRLAG